MTRFEPAKDPGHALFRWLGQAGKCSLRPRFKVVP
jgi:hypothetical protein